MLKVPVHTVPRAKFPAVDFHNHIDMAAPDQLLALMESANLATIVNFTGGFGETLRTQVAKFAPHGDRFVVFANVDWSQIDRPDFGRWAADELEAAVKAGARGLKVFKSLGLTVKDGAGRLIAVDDPRLDPIWARAGALGIPVAIHTSDPDAFFFRSIASTSAMRSCRRIRPGALPDRRFRRKPRSSPSATTSSRVIRRRRSSRCTSPIIPEDLAEVGRWLDQYPNMQVEIGARLNELGRQPYSARAFFLKYADRILFGTDSTPRESTYRTYFRFLETFDEHFDYFTSPTQGRWKIYGIGLPDDVLEKVYRDNARRVLTRR